MHPRPRRWLVASSILTPTIIVCSLLGGRWSDLAGTVPLFVARIFYFPAYRVCRSVFEGPQGDLIRPTSLPTRTCEWVVVVITSAVFAALIAEFWQLLGIPTIAHWSRAARNVVALGWVVVTLLVAIQVLPLKEWLHGHTYTDLDSVERLRLAFLYTALAVVLPIEVLLVSWRASRATNAAA